VFSDKPLTKSSPQPGSSKVFKILEYFEQYYVAEIHKSYLHLVRDTDLNQDGTFSTEAEDFGWIEMDKVLLWDHCLVNQIGTNRIGLIFMSQDTRELFIQEEKNGTVLQIVYIYKIDKNSLLIGRKPRIQQVDDKSGSSMIGWVPKEIVFDYNSRVFYESNSSTDAQQERIKANAPNVLFSNYKSAKKYGTKNSIDKESIVWKEDLYNTSISPVAMKLPIIEDKNGIIESFILSDQYKGLLENSDYESNNGLVTVYFAESVKSFHNASYSRTILLSKNELSLLLSRFEKVLLWTDPKQDTLELKKEIAERFGFQFGANEYHASQVDINKLFLNKMHCETI
jgi:hypothetical protein